MVIRVLQGAAICHYSCLMTDATNMPSLWSPWVIILWLHSHSISCNYPTYYSSPFTLSFTNLIMPSKFNWRYKFSNKAETKHYHTTDQIPLIQNIINYEALNYSESSNSKTQGLVLPGKWRQSRLEC